MTSKTQPEKSPWQTLSTITINEEHIKKKGKFRYISWAWAWEYVKDLYPDTTYNKHIFKIGERTLPYMQDDAGYAYVMVTVEIGDLKKTEVYPVTDHFNKSVKNPNSFDVNTALQRCLTKALAMHGFGHYIYAGEDLPPELDKPQSAEQTKAEKTRKPVEVKTNIEPDLDVWFETFKKSVEKCETEKDRLVLVDSAGKIKKDLTEEMSEEVRKILHERKNQLAA